MDGFEIFQKALTGTLRNPIGAYSKVSWVYACINAIAQTISSAPLVFYEKTKGGRTLIERNQGHELYDLFNPPKRPDIVSLRDLLFRTYIHLGLNGLCYWVFTEKKRKLVNVELRKWDELTPIKNSGGEVIGWTWRKDGRVKARYTTDLVLVLKYYDPFDDMRGLAPLKAAAISVLQENNIADWNAGFFKHGMKTPLVLSTDRTLTAKQRKELRKDIKDYYTGNENGHGAFIADGGLKAEPVPLSTKDIDFIMGKKLTREEICAAFGVPPSIVGIFEYSSFANAKEQRKIFWEQCLLPKMYALTDALQAIILDRRYPGIEVDWGLNQVYGLKSDVVDIAASAQVYSNLGYSKSEVALILDSPILDPDMLKSLGATPLPPDQQPGANGSGSPRNQPGAARPQNQPRLPTPNRPTPTRTSKNSNVLYSKVLMFLKQPSRVDLSREWKTSCDRFLEGIFEEVIEDCGITCSNSLIESLKRDPVYQKMRNKYLDLYSEMRSFKRIKDKSFLGESEETWLHFQKDVMCRFLACSAYNRIKFLVLKSLKMPMTLMFTENENSEMQELTETFPEAADGLFVDHESISFRDCVIN